MLSEAKGAITYCPMQFETARLLLRLFEDDDVDDSLEYRTTRTSLDTSRTFRSRLRGPMRRRSFART